MFCISSDYRSILLLISGFIIFIAVLGANFEFDLKRIIALSTLRQLGLMIMTIFIGLSGLAFFITIDHHNRSLTEEDLPDLCIVKLQVNQSRYRPGVAQRFPGS